MTRFITLAGRKQVGKDTSARMIENLVYNAHGEAVKVHIAHFADALKEACTAIFGIPRSDMESETGKKKLTDVLWPNATEEGYFAFGTGANTLNPAAGTPMTVREVLQFVGTELFRTQIDPDIWVKSIFRRQYSPSDIVVIADCRFPNEANYARERGLLVGIHRKTGLEGDTHVSETALDGYQSYHMTIENNGSFESLLAQWRELLQRNNLI